MKISAQKIIKASLISFFVLLFVAVPLLTFAQEINYIPLAPLPGIGDTSSGGGQPAPTTNLSTYLIAMFRLIIGLAALLAVIMITIGGIEYMSTDAISGKSAGKEKINNALVGLFLAIGAWLILYTVNPATLDFNFDIPPIETINQTQNGPTIPVNRSGVIAKVQYCYQDELLSNNDLFRAFPIYRYQIIENGGREDAYAQCLAAQPRALSRFNPPLSSGCPEGTYKEVILCRDMGPTSNTILQP